jgi:hypothetical protein
MQGSKIQGGIKNRMPRFSSRFIGKIGQIRRKSTDSQNRIQTISPNSTQFVNLAQMRASLFSSNFGSKADWNNMSVMWPTVTDFHDQTHQRESKT